MRFVQFLFFKHALEGLKKNITGKQRQEEEKKEKYQEK